MKNSEGAFQRKTVFEGQDDSTIVAFKQGSHYQATMSHDTVPDKKSGC